MLLRLKQQKGKSMVLRCTLELGKAGMVCSRRAEEEERTGLGMTDPRSVALGRYSCYLAQGRQVVGCDDGSRCVDGRIRNAAAGSLSDLREGCFAEEIEYSEVMKLSSEYARG